MTKDELLNSKHFCLMPWLHLHFFPNGKAFPCCVWDGEKPIGQYNSETSMMDIWNAPEMKELRVRMLKNEPSDGCKRCYVLEDFKDNLTLRETSLKYLPHHWDLVNKTKEDGELPEINMHYLDIRFSNLCNLRCRTCGPELSSAWHDDMKALDPNFSNKKVIEINPSDKFWIELEPLLLGVEIAYFAGGEPLLSDEQYKILDLWTKHKLFNIRINYITNFTLLTYKSSRILDYWKNFSSVKVSASLDDSGARAEYLRKGTNWEEIVRNRKLMMQECPNVTFELTPTISVFNVLHFPEFHWEWIESGLLDPNETRLNILIDPDMMSVRILPPEVKQLVKEKYESYLKKIQDYASERNLPFWQTAQGYHSLINYMMAKDDGHLLKKFFKKVHELDEVREEKFFSVYPELKILFLGSWE